MSSQSTPKSIHATTTRSKTEIWLVGHPLSNIEEPGQLPSRNVPIRRIYYEMKVNKATLSTACSVVADEMMSFWVKANIATTAKPHVVAKLKSLHQKHIKISKHKHRRSASQDRLEADYKLMMSQLFDIAHADWECQTPVHEDRQFLIDQRGPRQMSMTTEDMQYRQAAAKYLKRKLEWKTVIRNIKPSQLQLLLSWSLRKIAILTVIKPQYHMKFMNPKNCNVGQTSQPPNVHHLSPLNHCQAMHP